MGNLTTRITILKLTRGAIAVLALPVFLSCTMKANLEDISEAEVSFVEPAAKSFTNDTGYNFKVQMNSNNKEITPDKAEMEIYEGPGCDPAKLFSSNSMSGSGNIATSSSADLLEDGKTYSARVIVTNKDKRFQSKCSPAVGVDLQNPNPVAVSFPMADGYVSTKEIMAAWTTTSDNGISGLSEVPYRLRLFAAPACAGTALQTVNSAVEQYKFKKLTQGVTYSVQVASVDRAGNESILACSAYTEVDVNAPGFRFKDPTSIEGYSRVLNPGVSIDNDGSAAYWCFTQNTTFIPTTYTDACPGGTGTSAGWYTTRPTSLPLDSGDGLKAYNLWIVRADGSLISHNVASGAVTLDQTLPGAFTVTGVGGLTDTVFDIWFTSAGQPEVKWNASTDAVDYTVEILTAGNTLVCSKSNVVGTTLTFDSCPVLVNASNYKVVVTAFDVARNRISAPTFDFTVDRDPPGSFSITGITGGADLTNDHFFGSGSPTLNFTTATGSSHYQVQVKDLSGVNVCTLGGKADQSGYFDYASESGVNCSGLLHGGSYKAYVSAFDDGENETQAANNGFDFQVDTVVPTLTLDTVPSTPTSNNFANFAFSTADALSGLGKIECQLDAGAYGNCTSPVNLVSLSEGPHTYNVRSTDVAGNFIVASHAWRVDFTNPVLTILSQPPAYTNTTAISVSFSATDAAGIAKYECSIDGVALSLCSSPHAFTALTGPHTLVVRATDNTGFYDEKTVSFTVDVTDPALTLTSVPANPTHTTNTATIWFNTSDTNLSTVQCQLDAGAFAACSSPASYSSLAAGNHTVTVKTTDLAGNVTSRSTSWTLYTYVWIASGFTGCTATQPSWSVGGWYGCNAVQPAWQYGGWGGCSVSCGGGTQYRTQSCPVSGGSEYRSVSCPVSTGTEYRTPQCQRNDSTIVADSFCNAGTKPASSQACSRNDCAGATPVGTQACSRGGGGDCNTAQATAQACNPQSCYTPTWHVGSQAGTYMGGYCMGFTPGAACSAYQGQWCPAVDVDDFIACY